MTQPITTATRESAIQTALAAAKAAAEVGQGTAEEIRWKGGKLVLPVASVDVNLVLLSHRSHRIKAQLQSLPKVDQDVVESDPYGQQAQEIVARLLRETAGYEQIKNALAKDGQLNSGVLTTGGVLINANTRVVALRELRQQYVKVVVLPGDAGEKEITELELRLQMEQEVKQDYSFTSQLLFIEDLINSGNYTTLEVGRALRPSLTNSKADRKKAVDLVEGELRLLGLIRDVQAASGGALNFLYFDDNRQALIEIDQDYQKLKTTKPEEAARVKDAQLAAMIAGVDYRRLREIDAALLDTYVAPALQESGALAPHADTLLAPTAGDAVVEPLPGVDDILDEGEEAGAGGVSLSRLYTLLAQAKPDEDITIPAGGDTPVTLSRRAVAADLYGALSTAIDNKKRDSRQLDDLTAPVIHLKEAARVLDKAATAYADVHQRAGFDGGAFRAAVREYERAAAAFAATVAGTPGVNDSVEAQDAHA
jgi:hypothetical protein